jgi:hypothetical protein
MNRLAGRREWLGGPEATSTGKQLTGRAFATRVGRITGHLNDKISHIKSGSTNIVMGFYRLRRMLCPKGTASAVPYKNRMDERFRECVKTRVLYQGIDFNHEGFSP